MMAGWMDVPHLSDRLFARLIMNFLRATFPLLLSDPTLQEGGSGYVKLVNQAL